MRRFLGAIALLFCLPVYAGVVYNWETITGPTVSPLSGRVEVTQTAYRDGQLSYFYDGTTRPIDDRGHEIWEDPTAPLLMFAFGFYNGAGFQGDPVGGGFTNRYRTRRTGYEDYQDTEANLTFGSHLVGRLFGGGFGWVVDMQSDSSGIWTGSFTLDDGRYLGGCKEGNIWLCDAITGRWILDAKTVPASSTLPLVLLSLGVLAYRRRRSVN